MSLTDIDEIAGFDFFGDALCSVGWAKRSNKRNSMIFPNFLEFNEPRCLRRKPKTNAERQSEYRARRKQEEEATNEGVTKSNGSNDRRDETRRDENIKHVRVTGLLQVTTEHLQNTSALLESVKRESRRKRALISDSEHDQLRVLAAAEVALKAGKNPPAMFVDIVRNGHWEYLTADAEHKASNRLKQYRASNGKS